MIRPVLIASVEFENAALFLRLDLPSTLIRQEKGAFRKRSSNEGNLKRRPCVFVWIENILPEKGVFEKDVHRIIISLNFSRLLLSLAKSRERDD